MLLENRTKQLRFLCGMVFVLGSAVGTFIGALCSDSALNAFLERFLQWYAEYGSVGCFAGDMCLCFFCLLASATGIGCFLVPALDFLYGGILALILLAVMHTGCLQTCSAFILPLLLDALAIQRISALCTDLSLRNFRFWYSGGSRSFALQPIIRSVRIALAVLFLTFVLRSMCV